MFRILAVVLIVLSVAFAPIAGGATTAPAEMSMTVGGDHDCCPNAVQPCDMSRDGCMSMAACATLAFFSMPSEHAFVLPRAAAGPLTPLFSGVAPSRTSSQPLRPPQNPTSRRT